MFTKPQASADKVWGCKVLITGGRAPAALEMARLLAAASCEVIAAESAEHHLCRVSRSVKRSYCVPSPASQPDSFLAALEAIIQQEEVDWLIPTCEEIFFIASGYERLSKQCRVFTASLEQLRILHSKWQFIHRAESLGFSVPRTVLIRSAADWQEFAQSSSLKDMLTAGGCVLKPEYSRFAAKVRIAMSRQDVLEAASKIEPYSYPWVAQAYITGREICTYSIAHRGRLTAHAAYATQFSINGGANVYFEPLFHPAAQMWVSRFITMTSFHGQIAFDFIETEEGSLFPIECNPRTTSGVHLLSGNPDLAAALLHPEALQNKVVDPPLGKSSMLALPMLAVGVTGHLPWKAYPGWLGKWLKAKDATFRWSDPRPSLEQLFMLRDMNRTALVNGSSLIEATTSDIEWNGGEM